MFTRVPLETQTLYAELLEQLLGEAAARSLGHLRGSFVSKTINGEVYLYFQASAPGGRTRQFYVGKKTPALDKMVARFSRERVRVAPDRLRAQRLAAQLRIGGLNQTDSSSARVIRALAESGVFEAGGVLVGTHAFVLLGNLLGVRWSAGGALRTQDVDVAQRRPRGGVVEVDLDVAVPDAEVDVPSVLARLKMGFVPVPPLDAKHPSTSFKVRGQSLRVDLLCPGESADAPPVFLSRFGAAAQPLPFLEYLLEMPEHAVAVGTDASLVRLPAPARLAFHKLLVAPLRAAAFATKAEKDLGQAADLLEVLLEDRPGDLPLAWRSLCDRGRRWQRAGERGLQGLKRRRPALHARLTSALA
ncbi:MAG TPA: GSU2403 family nucleotidyltransferase fold protein [Polyangia bacterium]